MAWKADEGDVEVLDQPRRMPLRLLLLILVAVGAGAGVQASPGALRGPSTSKLLVHFKAGVTSAEAASLVRGAGAAESGTIASLGVHVLAVPSAGLDRALATLKGSPRVAFVEPDAPAVRFDTLPNDYWWPNEWAQALVNAPKAWDLARGAPSVVVAVLDSGVDPTQADLQGAFVPGWNTLAGSSDTGDTDGHGTMAAGVAVARSNNTIGIASYCWSCALMPVKVIDAGAGSVASVSAGITWATDHGARVISMSLGFTGSSSTLLSAVRYAHSHNVVVVAAAGNYGNSSAVYPAAYPEVLGVAGSDATDHLYSWSSFGSWVKLSAPGCNYATGRGNWYGTFCGTSSAAPVVAGLAGLAASYAPSATNTEIEQALESSAVSIGPSVAYGRVDAYKTLLGLGGGSTGSAPSITTAPTMSGTAEAGQTLTVSTGSWSGTAPMSYAYQWRRCDTLGGGCADITGAGAST
ncbi:MAG: thermitase, partial [Gaiellaceae bacterium]|nr:thermitase [Gaiellaceae bacterium]